MHAAVRIWWLWCGVGCSDPTERLVLQWFKKNSEIEKEDQKKTLRNFVFGVEIFAFL
jgi:hypothetical protein